MLVAAPEFAGLVTDHGASWQAWLTLTQASMMGLCFLAIVAPKNYAMKVCWCAAALWYTTQALDEALAGNLFADSLLEYVVFALYAGAIGYHLYSHERSTSTQ